MIPILYQTITEGSVPTHFGLGALTDCLLCEVTEERNGAYELQMSYAAQGIHASEIQLNRYIMAKPNFTDDPQIFQIYKIGKTMNGRFEVNAQHISYGLSGKVIYSGSANNIVTACAVLEASAGGFTIDTTKTTVGDFSINEPSSVRSWFGGKQGSLLDVYGTGEWKYDNFHCRLMLNRGADRGMQIRYGKNLTDLNQDLDSSNLYTHVVAYWKSAPTVVRGNLCATGLVLDTQKIMILDASGDFEEEPTVSDLDSYSQNYISNHNLISPTNNIPLNFQQSGTLVDRVDLCDTVTVYFEALDITAKFKCIKTKWDVLAERYIENEFGDPRTSIADTIAEGSTTVSGDNTEALNIARQALTVANDKRRVFIAEPVPPYDIGDLWINEEKILYCNTAKGANELYDEDDWTAVDTIDSTTLEDAIANASAWITGANGGYVIIHRTADGKPYELVISDTEDISAQTAKIWRWNINGLGYSSTGYDGTFTTAITSDGRIVADFITIGTLDANKIEVRNLNATMFTGATIVLGGYQNQDGTLVLRNSQNATIGVLDTNGMEFFGETVGGITPSVVFDKSGVTGYSDKDNKATSAISWTHKEDFHMKNGVVENEASFGNEIRFVPINNGTNKGTAIVKVV